MNAIEFNHVWKKFKRGEKFNSLRDTIPHLIKGMFTRDHADETLEDREFWAVKDVNFAIKRGEVVGIIGPNGAGKSTILKLLSGILVPNKGDLKINGRLSALIEVTAGFHPELTGRENVYLNGTILGMKKKELDERMEDIVEFSGIREFIDTPVKRYSSGMYSRLGFSVAAHINPEVLLVDEVLSVGDIAFQSKCAQKMREMLRGHVTIILVSHNLPLIKSLCSRVILLARGEVIREGHPEDIIPYYENLVQQEEEEALKRKVAVRSDKVRVNTTTAVEIDEVVVCDADGQQRDNFKTRERIKIKAAYTAGYRVEKPVFMVDVARADGVLCFTGQAENGFSPPHIEKKGCLEIDLGRLSLAPGIYSASLSIWDGDLIHPYNISARGVFRIVSDGQVRKSNPVIVQDVGWEFD